MDLNTQEAIYKEFRSATREHLMKHLRHAVDWERFHGIEQQALERTAAEHADWQESYHARLADARQIILRETHGNILKPPKAEAINAIPDRHALDVKADQRIRQDHAQRLSAIKQDELDQYKELRDTLRDRDRHKGELTRTFEQARSQSAQTRSGPSR